MTQFLQSSEVHDNRALRSFTFFGQSNVSEFLSCVQNTCDSITENQLEILKLFKSNLLVIKSEVDTCLNKLIGHELHLKNSKMKQCENSDSARNVQRTRKEPDSANNIVIHGLKKLKGVSKLEASEIVNSFFRTALEVNAHVENVHVLKKPTHSVAVLTLTSKSDRRKIFKSCHKLKDFHEKVSITDDLPVKERERRKQSLSSNEASPGPDDIPTRKPENVSNELNYRMDRIREIGSIYGFEEDDLDQLSYLIGKQNQERLKESSCICATYMQLNWKRLPEKFGRPIPNKFVKKLKAEMSSLIKAWNSEHDAMNRTCYCQQILSLTPN